MRTPDEEPIIFDVADDAEPVKPAKVFETLRPLAIWEDPNKSKTADEADALAAGRLSRTRLGMVVGGAVALLTLGFASGMYFESFWPDVPPAKSSPPDVASSYNPTAENKPAEPQASTDNNGESDLVPDEDTPSVFNVPTPAPTAPRRRPVRRRSLVARYRPRFSLATDRRPPRLIHPQFWVFDFTPTTLVIYVENGQVKTRIEPWPHTSNK